MSPVDVFGIIIAVGALAFVAGHALFGRRR